MNAHLHEPGARDVATRSLSRPSSPLDDELGLCRPISGGSLIWQPNQAQVGTTTRSAQPRCADLGVTPNTRASRNLAAWARLGDMCGGPGRQGWVVNPFSPLTPYAVPRAINDPTLR